MIKLVDRSAALEMKDLYNNGVKQSEIAVKFNQQGFAKKTGNPLNSLDVSYYIRVKAKGRRKQVVKGPTKTSHTDNFMLDVLVNKNLSTTQKVRVLTALIGE